MCKQEWICGRDSCRRQLEVKNVAVFDEIRKIREIREIRPAGNGGFPKWDWWKTTQFRKRKSLVFAKPKLRFLAPTGDLLEHVGKSVCKLSDLIVLTVHHISLFIHKYV